VKNRRTYNSKRQLQYKIENKKIKKKTIIKIGGHDLGRVSLNDCFPKVSHPITALLATVIGLIGTIYVGPRTHGGKTLSAGDSRTPSARFAPQPHTHPHTLMIAIYI